MKFRFSLVLALAVLAAGPVVEVQAQRGSHGSGRPSGGGGSSARPSGGGSARPSGGGGSVRPSGGSSIRPSGGGGSRSSAPAPSSGSRLSGGSIRPSSPAVRPGSDVRGLPPSRSSDVGRPAGRSSVDVPRAPQGPSGTGTVVPGSPSSGSGVYTGRSVTPTNTDPQTAPDGDRSSGAGSGYVPPSRLQPRVRFPAPYSPAGSTIRSSRPQTYVPTTAAPGRTGAVDPRSPSIGSGPPSAVSSGKKLDYVRGPTRRLEAPRTAQPPAKSSDKTVRPSGKSGAGKAGTVTKPTSADVRKGFDDLGKLRRTDPKRAKEILTTSSTLGRVHDAAVRTAVGKLGGVYDSPYRGGGSGSSGDWCNYPWGFNCHDDDIDFFFGVSFGWGCNPCSWWWWPCYVGWYYPYYCSTYYPWYYYQSCYAYPVYTTIYYPYNDYGGQQVVYAEPTQVAEEPVGESVARYESAPAPAPSTLSIAAQRYLDLGDRAFREGRYTDAVQFYAKAVEFAPDEGALYLVLADALFAAGDYHYGAYAIRRALELDASLVDVEIDKRSFYPDPSAFERQLSELEGYVTEHPDDRDARLVLALNYLFGGRAKDAVRELEVRQAGSDDPAAARILAAAQQRAP